MRLPRLNTVARALAAVCGVAAGVYAALATSSWLRYGRPGAPRDPNAADDVLDRFMPRYDVVERHRIGVDAPAAISFRAARAMDITQTPLARVIFRAREVLMGGHAMARRSEGFVADMLALGWGLLTEIPEREVVMGGVTKPWEANPVFRALPPHEFAAFDEPGFVKIAFTLRADPRGEDGSVFRTETRALATDAFARGKFRLYWSLLSPGIMLIRKAALRPVKVEAERQFGAEHAASGQARHTSGLDHMAVPHSSR